MSAESPKSMFEESHNIIIIWDEPAFTYVGPIEKQRRGVSHLHILCSVCLSKKLIIPRNLT